MRDLARMARRQQCRTRYPSKPSAKPLGDIRQLIERSRNDDEEWKLRRVLLGRARTGDQEAKDVLLREYRARLISVEEYEREQRRRDAGIVSERKEDLHI